jgi:hypothetical protein
MVNFLFCIPRMARNILRTLQEIQPLGPAFRGGAQSCFGLDYGPQIGVVLPLWHFTLLQVTAPVPVPVPSVENVNGVVPHSL